MAREDRTIRTHRIGLVGTGGIAKAHVRGYAGVVGDRVCVTAGCDPDGDRLTAFCDRWAVPHRFDSPEALLGSGEVDAIVLLTPPAVRAEYILPALERDIHVLVEKPFGNSVSECRQYVDAAEASGATLAVSQNLRFYPDIEWAQRTVAAGRLGELTYICHDHHQWRTSTSGWRAEEQRLEIAIFSIHILDRIRWVAGLAPERVSCVTRKGFLAGAPRGEMFTDLRIEFAGGAVGRMTSSWYGRPPQCLLRVDGKAGSLVTDRRSATAEGASGVLALGEGKPETRSFQREGASTLAFGYSMQHFIDAIEAGAEPIHSGRDNLQTMAIVDAAYLSAERAGAPVETAEVMGE